MPSSPASHVLSPVFSRVLALAALIPVAAAISCADDSAVVAPPPVAAPARTRAPAGAAAPGADAGAPAPQLPAVDVAGRVVDDAANAVVGRSIVIVDRRGMREEVMTDEGGGFHAGAVSPPYDVLVDAAPSGAVTTPLVFFGLVRADPHLEVFEAQGPVTHPAPQTVHVGVKLPRCRDADAGCWISVVTSSPNGGGGTAGSYVEGTADAAFDLEHAWRSPAVDPNETIDVHVLVGDAEYTQYAYGHVVGLAPKAGAAMDAGVVIPVPVPASEPVSVAAGMNGAPDGWEWTLASELELAGGTTLALRYEFSTTSAMRLPLLPGATWHVGAWVQHPPTPDRPWFHRSAQAWSGTLPLSTTNIALDVPAVPEPLRPTIEGAFSRRARAFVWDDHAPALASVVLVDLATGQQRFRAFTTEPQLSLRRLEALGVRRIAQGAHVLDLTTTPGATVDELTDPDDLHRRDRFDVHVTGGSTYQRFQFVVTP